MIKEPLGENQLQHGVAEEFQPLVVKVVPLRLMPERRVRERLRKQERIAELIFEALFERVHPDADE
jgi:hypothetical protein